MCGICEERRVRDGWMRGVTSTREDSDRNRSHHSRADQNYCRNISGRALLYHLSILHILLRSQSRGGAGELRTCDWMEETGDCDVWEVSF